jgi:8-oxo-dGTP pyrophosphatase MutT (NUDIX family)
MREQKSVGIVLFRNASNKNEFLLLEYPQGHWDFIKGKVEQGETQHETALRETKEETDISDIEFIDGFEESVEYNFRFKNEDIHKCFTVRTGFFESRIVLPTMRKSLPFAIAFFALPPCLPIPGE